MSARYQVPISNREARQFLRLEISARASIPHGSKCYWLAGLRFVSDQPGLYLVAGSTGMEGVLIVPPVIENVGEIAS